jgi:coenzyme F420-reducing hydrogenase delta subunit
MAKPVCPDAAVYVCVNCIPGRGHLPRQWTQDGAHVLVREVPCSGKMDGQYLLHVLEAGARGLCVVTCPKGECQLTQGNYRAEVRLGTIRRLLTEIGIEPERVALVHTSPEDRFDQFEQRIHDVVGRICALGDSPVRVETPLTQGEALPENSHE